MKNAEQRYILDCKSKRNLMTKLSSGGTWVSRKTLGLLLSCEKPERSSALEETDGYRGLPVNPTVCSRSKSPTFSALRQQSTSNVTLNVLGRSMHMQSRNF